jgi:AraC-like DNA-binding protein
MWLPEDILGLRRSLAPLYISQALVYLYLIFIKMKFAPAEGKFAFFGRKDKKIGLIFNIWIHLVIVVGLVIFIKINFERDLGDYLIGTYISVMLYINGFLVVSRQISRHHDVDPEEIQKPKYEKSPLSEEKKSEIMNKITILFEQKKYFSKNTLSLAELAKAVNEPPHYVSQVINEKLDKNFFDLLSGYRISEAKILLHEKAGDQLTIEEIAETVGYNSKAAFNKAFKTITGVTPSEFRKNR